MLARAWKRLSHRTSPSRILALVRPQLLSILRAPGVVPALVYFLVYGILAAIWWIYYHGGWAPAWPAHQRVYVLLLAAAVLSAALALCWLLARALVLPVLLRAPQHGGAAQYVLLGQMEDGAPEDDLGADEAPQRVLPVAAEWRSAWWWVWVVLCAAVAGGGCWSARTYEHPGDIRYRPELRRALAHPIPAGYNNGEKVFIAAAFFDNKDVLPYWSDTLLKVISFLGTANVFVSIVESNSVDRTRDLLRTLDSQLADASVRRRILLDDQTIQRPQEMAGNPRIEFLSAVRNRALEPLVEAGGFDKVLFSNDIFIEPESVIELLKTADGAYDMACGLDFGQFGSYDAWVLRDRLGRLTSTLYAHTFLRLPACCSPTHPSSWPYFLDAADYAAMQAEAPVPVFACWNGIAALQADPFLPVALRANRTLSPHALPGALPATHPAAHDARLRGPSPALTPPVRFRASAPRECFSSECFLLAYDLRRQFALERVFVNPRVVVAYAWRYYVWYKWVVRHWAVKWWVERVWGGAWMQYAVMVVGDPERVFTWDGGECHPWW
ncbi:cryptococcal mannosyltransferase 1-domain-containing protein [Amylocystis lapponica]|nr:cryptococcal mannosyltransferase 1-domain-containing protein [Amylocystis lapponica]